MFSITDMSSTTSVLSAYTSIAAWIMLIRSIMSEMQSMATQFIPQQVRDKIYDVFKRFGWGNKSSELTLVIQEEEGRSLNLVFEASAIYLRTKVSPTVGRLRVSKVRNEEAMVVTIEKGEVIMDEFEGIKLTWRLIEDSDSKESETYQWFELYFDKRYKEKVITSYLPFVENKAKSIKDESKIVRLHCPSRYNSIIFDHPSTFDTLAMDPDTKAALINDIDMFVSRKEFYKRIGKAWKRGYLLYGPPGTGKSSLIAAMANYLKFHVYDLELSSIHSDGALKDVLLRTSNKSILVIEDIDCAANFQNREDVSESDTSSDSGFDSPQFTLSGFLNFMDGLWSSTGDERIIVFTTNYKERIDPALLRPGRMDYHIHMSYCTPGGFKILASNYLSIQDHRLFEQIIGLIEKVEVTPAEIAQQLMKSYDVDIALEGLVQFFQLKIDKDAIKDTGEKEAGDQKKIDKDARKNEGDKEVRRKKEYLKQNDVKKKKNIWEILGIGLKKKKLIKKEAINGCKE